MSNINISKTENVAENVEEIEVTELIEEIGRLKNENEKNSKNLKEIEAELRDAQSVLVEILKGLREFELHTGYELIDRGEYYGVTFN